MTVAACRTGMLTACLVLSAFTRRAVKIMQRIAARDLQEKCQQRRDGYKLSNKVYQDLPSNQDAVRARWKLQNRRIINSTLATVNAFEMYLQILCKSNQGNGCGPLCGTDGLEPLGIIGGFVGPVRGFAVNNRRLILVQAATDLP